MAVNVAGLVSVIVFYLVVMGTGFWASRKSKRAEARCTATQSEVMMVGGRNLKTWVSIFTTTATAVGGGYIMGSAEVVYNPTRGLVWCILPLGFFVNLNIVGLFFVKPVRSKNYVTIMDPFQEKYGNRLTACLFIPFLMADVLWVASVLAALGGTMSVILDISSEVSIVISAAVAILYTLLGGLYSVAYTDVIQLVLMLLGLWFCVPFAMLSPATVSITNTSLTSLFQEPWVGSIQVEDLGAWLDEFLIVSIGSVCYQELYQRILATSTVLQAQVTCCISAFISVILVIPSVLIGAVAASTDWNQTSYGLPTPYEEGKAGSILPIVLQHLCPQFVSLVGIGALAAAVMSSIDSALLSSSSLFARNFYKAVVRTNASEREILWAVKVSILVFGVIATALSMTSNSVFGLWILSVDVMYTVVCAQLLAVLFLSRHVNRYGALGGLATSAILRGLAGEPSLGIMPVWTLPGDRLLPDGSLFQGFPFRTAIFLISIASILLWSKAALWVFTRGYLPPHWDVFEVRRPGADALRREIGELRMEESKEKKEQLVSGEGASEGKMEENSH